MIEFQLDSASGVATYLQLVPELCNSAFDGMQPTFRHVPPKVLSFSITAVFNPS